jgi:serine/alanine adding enzyme
LISKNGSSLSHFRIVNSFDTDRWNQFVYQHSKGSIFHTSHMMEVFKGTRNHEPLFLAAIDEAGEILALLTCVRVKTLNGLLSNLASRSIFYAEPICREDHLGVEALAALLAKHDHQVQRRVLFTEVRPLSAGGEERTALAQCGYDREGYLNYLTDLRKPIDELWRNTSNPCRANIRRGQKAGITIEDVTSEKGLEILYRLLQLTFTRARIPLPDKSLFSQALKILQPRDMLKIFVAHYKGSPIGASAVLLYKKICYEWYWGVERVKSVYPAECLTWHRIEWAQQNNYELYDFGGAGWPDKPYGVRDFKSKFGGELVNYGRYRRIYSPWKLALAEKAFELSRSLISRRCGRDL